MIEAVNIHIRIVLVALSTLFTHPCLANYPADNAPIFGITCANPDSVNISQLNFFNKEVKHGYLDSINSQKKLSSDDVIKIADIDRFPSEMLDRKNIQFKT